MRLIKSSIPRANPTIPVLGGFRVQFENYKAVVPDVVATVLLGHPFYTDAGSVGDAVQNAKVLVVRDAGLGDVLLTTPLICNLHREKGATVDVLTADAYRCLFDGNPNVRQTLALEHVSPDDERRVFADYDVVLDLRLVVENAEAAGINEHRADAFAKYGDITLSEAERRPDYFVTEEERRVGEAFREALAEAGRKTVIGFVWQSSTSNRNWSEQTNYAVIDALESAGFGVVILDDAGRKLKYFYDGDGCNHAVLDMTGAFTLRQAAAVLQMCDAVITPDTGLFHLAAALDVPTFTYFGAFPVDERAAHKSLVVLNEAIATDQCGLAPCRSYTCFNRDAAGQSRCLAVSPELVVARLNETLKTAAKKPSRKAIAVPEKETAHAPVEFAAASNDPQTNDGNARPAQEPDTELGCDSPSDCAGTASAAEGGVDLSAGGQESDGDPCPVLQSDLAERSPSTGN